MHCTTLVVSQHNFLYLFLPNFVAKIESTKSKLQSLRFRGFMFIFIHQESLVSLSFFFLVYVFSLEDLHFPRRSLACFRWFPDFPEKVEFIFFIVSMADRGGKDDGASIAGRELFGPYYPPILTLQNLLDLKAKYGVPDEIEMVLPDPSKSPHLVRLGYCCAYAPYFMSCGLTFLIPSFLFDVLDHLGLTFSQMCPNFVHHVINILVCAKEEHVIISVADFLRICDVKPNSGTRGTYYL